MIELDEAEAILIDSETNEILLTAKPLRTSDLEKLPMKKYHVEFKTEDGQVFTRYTDYFEKDDENKVIHIEGLKIEYVD